MSEVNEDNSVKLIDQAAAQARMAIPPEMAGRGIVICGGGLKYFTCAWVCINVLRHVKCKLPIELWHLGEREANSTIRRLVSPLNVRCVDALEVRKNHPARTLNGWEIKPYAMMHSSFREVMLLDSDNVVVSDPEFLFDTTEFREFGAGFWPDFGRLGRNRSIWNLAGIAYRDEPEFETGQIIVDKARCWPELSLTMWMNEHSDFWYQHVHGDKETFHTAWRKLRRDYAMPSRGIERLVCTMCQHDYDGRRLFQHRNLDKWSLDGNRHVPGFEHESLCRTFVEQLRPHLREIKGIPAMSPELAKGLAGQQLIYHRIGHDQRPVMFQADGTVSVGSERMERYWHLAKHEGQYVLEIYGDDGLTAKLFADDPSAVNWRGKWLIHEQMPVELTVRESGNV